MSSPVTPDRVSSGHQRKLSAILCADVAGFSRLMDEDEAATYDALKRLRGSIDPLIHRQCFPGRLRSALAQVDRALALNPSASENFQERGYLLSWSGKPAETVPWLEATLRLDGSTSRAAFLLGAARYFLGQYAGAVAALDRALASSPGRVIQLNIHAILAAAYARLERPQDAERERAVIASLQPFLEAERFAAQFGTKEARGDMLVGLKAAGFH